MLNNNNSMMKQQRKKENQKQKGNYKKIANDKKFNNNPHNKPLVNLKKQSKGGQQMPTIQNMLEIKKQDRSTKTADYFKKVKPFLGTYLQKKQGSRAVQLMFKWGDAQIKSSIFKAIVQNWKQLIKSNYALHTISKVSTQFEFPRLVEDAINLQNNKEGSIVLQNFINKHPGSPQALAISAKFEAIQKQAATKGFQSQQVLHNLAMKSIQKQYYNTKISKLILKLALPTMIENERQKAVEFLAEKALDLTSDEQGVRLFVLLYNYFDSKQKKNIITKQLKGKVYELMQLSKMSYVALVKLITETDDTVMIGNKTVQQLLEHVSEISNQNSKLYNVLISILSPRNNNFNCLGKLQQSVPFTTCKKPEQTRKKEIRQFIYPVLVQHLTNSQNIDATCTTPNQSRLALGLIKSMQTDGSQNLKKFATTLIQFFINNLENLKQKNSKNIDIQNSLIANNFGSKLIKNVLLLQQTYIDKYCDKLSQLFKRNLQKVLHSNASFVLTVLIEKGRNQLIEEIKRSKIDVSKARASDFYMNRMKNKVK